METLEKIRSDDNLRDTLRLVGHDLRNRLGVMKNSAYYLSMKLDGDEGKVTKHLDMLLEEIKLSNRTIVNLVDLIAPKKPDRAQVDLNELVRETVEGVPAAEGIELDFRLMSPLVRPLADAQQLQDAMSNILTYQLAELEEGDTLRIVSRADGQLYVEFIDSGDGLAEEELEDLFALRRFDGSCARNIGLIAACGLIELNEGSLEVESREGMGTRFSVVLPID